MSRPVRYAVGCIPVTVLMVVVAMGGQSASGAERAHVSDQPYLYDSFDTSHPFARWRYEPDYDPALHLSVPGRSGQGLGLRTTPTSWGPNPRSQNTNIYLHPNDAHAGWLNGRVLGQDTWYRVWMRFPADYKAVPGGWNWLVIWHDDHETQRNGADSFALGVIGSSSRAPRLRLRPAGGSSTSPTYGDVRLPRIMRDRWYDLVFHFVWHTSPTIGKYEMWLDAAPVASASFPTLYMNPSGNHSYNIFDLINYHAKATWTSEVHFDEVRIGPSAASVGFTPLQSADIGGILGAVAGTTTGLRR
jgi:Polysaccharide lyase